MKTCKLCGKEINSDHEGDLYCCSGCEAVDQIISTMDLSGDELAEKKNCS